MRSPTTWKRKWPGLDHAGVDRPDGDLVGVVAAHAARSSASSVEVVVDERPQRLVAVEADAVEVVRLALVPVGGRGEVDDRGHGALVGGDRLEPGRAVRRDEQRAHERAAAGRVQAGEAPAVGERPRDRVAVGVA